MKRFRKQSWSIWLTAKGKLLSFFLSWPKVTSLTLFGLAYFGVSGIYLNIFRLGGWGFQFFFGNNLPRNDLPYSKGFMKVGCPDPSKKMFDFWNFWSSKRRLIRFLRVPPYEISDELYFFSEMRQLYGVKDVLPLSKLITEKRQVLSMHLYAYLHRYTQIRDRGGAQCAAVHQSAECTAGTNLRKLFLKAATNGCPTRTQLTDVFQHKYQRTQQGNLPGQSPSIPRFIQNGRTEESGK